MTAASTGINMVAASIVIFAELFWNPGTLIQAEDRCHRIGQRAPFVAIRYLLAKKTVDDVIWPLIGRKLGVVGSALNGQRDFLAVDKVSAHAATAITPYDLPTDPIQSLGALRYFNTNDMSQFY
jgi:SWI/SNF-related matrix-associated actin-dependent regulator 1 of chromatin subfamily A